LVHVEDETALENGVAKAEKPILLGGEAKEAFECGVELFFGSVNKKRSNQILSKLSIFSVEIHTIGSP